MAHHGIDDDEAFALLRAHSQRRASKLVDMSAAIVDVHVLLLPGRQHDRVTPNE